MKLSQDIIFFRLLMKYPVHFKNRNTACKDFDYPIIYDARTFLSGHAVIIHSDEPDKLIELNDSEDILYICIGDNLSGMRMYEASMIIVEKNTSLISLANDVYEIYHEFDKWDASLKTVLYDNGSFQDLVNQCDSIIIEPIAITDKNFQIIAYSQMSDELGYNVNVDEDKHLSLNAFNSFITQVDFARACRNRDVFILKSMGSSALSRNIFYTSEYVGSIGIKLSTEEDYLQAFNSAILAHFHSYAERLYAKYASFDNPEYSKDSLVTILEDKLNNNQFPDKVNEEFYKQNRWQTNDQLQLFQFFANPLQDKALYASYLSKKISRIWQKNICFTYKDHLLLLVNVSECNNFVKADFFKTLSSFLIDNSLIAGISRTFNSLSYLRSSYDQTQTAAEIGIIRNPQFIYFLFDDYVLDYMLQESRGHYEKEEICCSKLMALIKQDETKRTDYYRTLQVYFQCKFNAAEAAKRLYINRSTFHYRLNRIQELAQIDFESDDELLYMAMSMKLLSRKESDRCPVTLPLNSLSSSNSLNEARLDRPPQETGR